jgi:hypothetical protein
MEVNPVASDRLASSIGVLRSAGGASRYQPSICGSLNRMQMLFASLVTLEELEPLELELVPEAWNMRKPPPLAAWGVC